MGEHVGGDGFGPRDLGVCPHAVVHGVAGVPFGAHAGGIRGTGEIAEVGKWSGPLLVLGGATGKTNICLLLATHRVFSVLEARISVAPKQPTGQKGKNATKGTQKDKQ